MQLIAALVITVANVFSVCRRVWTAEEDIALRQVVAKYGSRRWAFLAECMAKEHAIAGRTGKQCRDRWHSHLGAY